MSTSDAPVQYFGVTRFSTFLPLSSAWVSSRDGRTESEYKAHLFSDERMEPRVRIFVDRALPIYQSMAERHEYRHIVHYSDSLPTRWREELEEAARKYPVLHLDKVETRINSTQVMLEQIGRRTPDADVVVWFRVDDDDLLSADFLDRLSVYATPKHSGYAVSFGMGLAGLYVDGQYTEFRKVHGRLPSQGQAYVGRYDHLKGVLQFPRATAHSRQDTVSPVIYDSRDVSYVYTFHDQQDQGLTTHGSAAERLARFPLLDDVGGLATKFPTIARDISTFGPV
ncbi:hypothetical protein GCM10010413_50620 [Promicromonospora sukumoe]|uniref:Rhamnosyltransferase n=1 Tax=Promicromonospora sukumoe TaxID=88382 RepID=A0A7W3PC30_9MICO|nr:glycosyltransferase [Promicromonospora sukumoe]MBA8806308.1 hypothetical protein [Promicromonospora sukumoe]